MGLICLAVNAFLSIVHDINIEQFAIKFKEQIGRSQTGNIETTSKGIPLEFSNINISFREYCWISHRRRNKTSKIELSNHMGPTAIVRWVGSV